MDNPELISTSVCDGAVPSTTFDEVVGVLGRATMVLRPPEGDSKLAAACDEGATGTASEPTIVDVGTADLKQRASAVEAEKRFEEAEQCWREVLVADGEDSEAMCGVAVCLLEQERIDDASSFVRRVLTSPIIHYHPRIRLGSKLVELHRLDDAVAMFRSVTAGFPNQADAWNHLGATELGAGLAAPALASLRRASLLQPTSAAIWCNIALALMNLDRLPEALAANRRALAIEPASPVATFNMGATLLAMGRLMEGFAAYESRFALGSSGWARQDVAAPPWTGEPLAGRSILVVSEQANGDQFQFVRYLPELCRRGARVTYMVPARLQRLIRSLVGDITLIESPEAGSRFDYQVPLLSLPHRCAAEDGRAPAATPYLYAEAERVARWRERIGSHGFRIAIAWEGFRYPGGRDLGRCFPVEALWPVAQTPGVRLISLQLKDGLDQLARLPAGMTVETLGEDFDAGEHAFLDTAAVMMNVDLVVTLDSGVAHLAGALARPTWLALPFSPEWRWQRTRVDTPWYPTMRLFRQGLPGDWDGVFQRMAEALAIGITARPQAPVPQSTPAPALPLVPVSCGEVLDKITILEIKERRLTSSEAIADVVRELRLLRIAAGTFSDTNCTNAQLDRLRTVNKELWDVEDNLRLCEAEGRFDEQFVTLARSVYALNDERAAIKRTLNAMLGSDLIEHKSYGEAGTSAVS